MKKSLVLFRDRTRPDTKKTLFRGPVPGWLRSIAIISNVLKLRHAAVIVVDRFFS